MTKKLLILVGPQGSGKSTYCQGFVDYTYINQDKQGRDGHWQLFQKALGNGENIVVDRINHLRQQRMRYVTAAREAGYQVTIKIFSEKYKTCLDRIVNREGHQTLKAGDIISARNALDMYFNQFEYPRQDEYDVLFRPDFIYGHSFELWNPNKTFIIGDGHGCFDEVINLIADNDYSPKNFYIMAGDLNDRGPKTNEIIKKFIEAELKHFFAIRGNHDDKLIRWLRGNKVNTESLELTISQLNLKTQEEKDSLYYKMMDMPYIIRVGKDNYITHAGFHPEYEPMCNSKEFSIYARYYDPAIRTFTNDKNCKYWFDYKKDDGNKYYFGHIIFDEMPKVKDVYALDGGCYRGGTLRAAVLVNNEFSHIVETPSLQPKLTGKDATQEWDHMNKFEPYDKLVDLGYLSRKEKGDLVLYNYTEKCTFEKHWNKYTMECRGLILNKETGDTVARPFPKFFNLSELENKELGTIPVGESYKVYDKADGSLGILYKETSGNYRIATRGSFESDQSVIATNMFHEKAGQDEIDYLDAYMNDWTLCFEIIYPENRFNDGARLVCDYGDTKTLILLAAIHKVSGKSLSYESLTEVGLNIGFPVVQQFDYTIEQLVEMKKTLPVTQEGWVIQFDSGFRVKIKGDEYCKLQKILNSISPLSIWEKMQDDPAFRLTSDYKKMIPEEILPEVEAIERTLSTNYALIYSHVGKRMEVFQDNNPNAVIKDLALHIQAGKMGELPSGMFFSCWNGQIDRLHDQIIRHIRPKANEL